MRVSSRRGSIVLRAKVTQKTTLGVVFISMHFAEAAANTLTLPVLDPIAKIPGFKECAVRISRVGPPAAEDRGKGIGRSASSPDVAAKEGDGGSGG